MAPGTNRKELALYGAVSRPTLSVSPTSDSTPPLAATMIFDQPRGASLRSTARRNTALSLSSPARYTSRAGSPWHMLSGERVARSTRVRPISGCLRSRCSTRDTPE
uniref:Uncharacterized protein n=3 Tax=Oryza TaxID=4527 RepID=A0A0D3EJ24_9ORYZ